MRSFINPRILLVALGGIVGGAVFTVTRPELHDTDRHEQGLVPGASTRHDYPDHVGEGFAPAVQGVAHDEAKFWYFSNTPNGENFVWKYPITSPLVDDVPTVSRQVFTGYEHIGDLDYYQGYLYVPLERNPKKAGPPAIGLLDKELNEVALVPMPDGVHAPWCAIDENSGRLYTSEFDATELRVYEIVNPGPGLELRRLPPVRLRFPGASPLSQPVARIQGGDISPSGTLYLSTDTVPSVSDYALGPPYTGGIQAIVAETGVTRFSVAIDFDPRTGDELEGIDFWDLETDRPPGAPAGMRGECHVLKLHNDVFGDDAFSNFSFLHHRVADPALSEL